jgi:23S rRNA pseudouridine2457 synthase
MHQHFIIHKPYGFLSQFINPQRQRRNKKLLGELYDFPEGTMSIGRLDEKSEGLLFLTTNGKVSAEIRSSKFEKEYYVQVDGEITEDAIQELKNGVEIGFDGQKYMTKKCNAFKLSSPPNFPERTRKVRDDRHGPTCWVSITITEGKFRQVRKMTAAVGFPTLRLMRVRIGDISINELKSGEVIEVDKLF